MHKSEALNVQGNGWESPKTTPQFVAMPLLSAGPHCTLTPKLLEASSSQRLGAIHRSVSRHKASSPVRGQSDSWDARCFPRSSA
jgi:hypothetical protein